MPLVARLAEFLDEVSLLKRIRYTVISSTALSQEQYQTRVRCAVGSLTAESLVTC